MSALGIIAITAAVVGLGGMGIAFAMSRATSKSVDAMARQPEAAGKINTSLMFGLIMMETCAVYGLLVAILLIFILGGSI